MKRKSLIKVNAKGNKAPFVPPYAYHLTFNLTDGQRAALLRESMVVVMLPLEKPVEFNGETFRCFVQPLKLMPDGPPVQLGDQVLCRNEEEAISQREEIFANYRKQEEDRMQEEAQRAIKGDVLKSFKVRKGKGMTVHGIPITELRNGTGAQVPASQLPPGQASGRYRACNVAGKGWQRAGSVVSGDGKV